MYNEKAIKNKSKFLSLVLRHRPELIGIQLNPQGWVRVDELLEKMAAHGKAMDFATLTEVVVTNNKKRFAFNEDQTMIRANQGHSINIDLGYMPAQPPEFLYHGTASRFVNSILQQGIQKRQRHHVHLSADLDTARSVGSRHGSPVILQVQARLMQAAGIAFFRSENGVWLTEHVDPKYILTEIKK